MNEAKGLSNSLSGKSLPEKTDSIEYAEKECDFCSDVPEHLICLTCQHYICIVCAVRDILLIQSRQKELDFSSITCKFCDVATELFDDVQQALVSFVNRVDEQVDNDGLEIETMERNEHITEKRPSEKRSTKTTTINCQPILEEDEDNYRECDSDRSHRPTQLPSHNSLAMQACNRRSSSKILTKGSPERHESTEIQPSGPVQSQITLNKSLAKLIDKSPDEASPQSSKYDGFYKLSYSIRENKLGEQEPIQESAKNSLNVRNKANFEISAKNDIQSPDHSNDNKNSNDDKEIPKHQQIELKSPSLKDSFTQSKRLKDSPSLSKANDVSFKDYSVYEIELTEKFLENFNQNNSSEFPAKEIIDEQLKSKRKSAVIRNQFQSQAEVRESEHNISRDDSIFKTVDQITPSNLQKSPSSRKAKSKKRRKKAVDFKAFGKIKLTNNMASFEIPLFSSTNPTPSLKDTPLIDQAKSQSNHGQIDNKLFEALKTSPNRILRLKNSQIAKGIKLFSPIKDLQNSSFNGFPKIIYSNNQNPKLDITNQSISHQSQMHQSRVHKDIVKDQFIEQLDTVYTHLTDAYKHSSIDFSDLRFNCQIHHDQEYIYFDKNEKQPICSVCLLDKKASKTFGIHDLIAFKSSLPSIMENSIIAINDIKLVLKIINNKREDFEIRNQNFTNYASSHALKIDKLFENLITQINSIRKSVADSFEEYSSRLTESLKTELNDLEHIYNSFYEISDQFQQHSDEDQFDFGRFIDYYLARSNDLRKLISESNEKAERIDYATAFEGAKADIDSHYSSAYLKEVGNIKKICDGMMLTSIMNDNQSHSRSFHSKSNVSGKSVAHSKLILNTIATHQKDQIKSQQNDIYLRDILSPKCRTTLEKLQNFDIKKPARVVASFDDGYKGNHFNFSKKLKPNLGQLSLNQKTNDIFEPLKKLLGKEKEKQKRGALSSFSANLSHLNVTTDVALLDNYAYKNNQLNTSVSSAHANFDNFHGHHHEGFANKIENEKRLLEEKIRKYGVASFTNSQEIFENQQVSQTHGLGGFDGLNAFVKSRRKTDNDEYLPLRSLLAKDAENDHATKDQRKRQTN